MRIVMPWTHYIADIDGRNALILVDDSFKAAVPLRELPRLAWFGVYASALRVAHFGTRKRLAAWTRWRTTLSGCPSTMAKAGLSMCYGSRRRAFASITFTWETARILLGSYQVCWLSTRIIGSSMKRPQILRGIATQAAFQHNCWPLSGEESILLVDRFK
jgi:hypothetical protein